VLRGFTSLTKTKSQYQRCLLVMMMMMTMRTFAPLLFLLLTLPATHVAGAATELTLDTFEKEVAGKNGFVKFFAPWW
jgi:hypothetical protein